MKPLNRVVGKRVVGEWVVGKRVVGDLTALFGKKQLFKRMPWC